MVSMLLPERMSEELDALISAGYYDNKSEVLREAFRHLLTTRKELRLVIAIELYKNEKATISRAAEVAGVSYEDMKTILIAEKLLKRGSPSAMELKKKAKKLQGR